MTVTDIPEQLARFGRDDEGQQRAAELLTRWATVGEPAFRRAGALRGLATLGHVWWAAGLGSAAEAALRPPHGGVALAPVLSGAALVAAGLVLRAVLLAAADRVADDGAAAVQAHLRTRLLLAALPSTGTPAAEVGDAALGEAPVGHALRGSMANALLQAIGALFLDRGQQAVSLSGGGFSMLTGDCLTLVRYGLPVKVPALRTVALSRPGRRTRGGEWSPR
ncbi:hypothetical protein GCM10010361_26000 [Streptomyces olivaceiscleroticus]|uniref:Uncharacterized protein n=1 Tax=Streptomyces olivaceiscleroticus TaxID=68245 RepID=A0ABN0ZW27_9ACTN